jgi:hypothetical protein
VIYSRRKIAETREQQSMFVEVDNGKMEPFDKAVQILDRVGARQWKATTGQWCISMPARCEVDQEVSWAVKQMEEAANARAILIWSKRKD